MLKVNCKEAARLLSQRQDRPLPAADTARLRLHLVMCDACRNVAEQFDFLRRAMRHLSKDETPPPQPPP